MATAKKTKMDVLAQKLKAAAPTEVKAPAVAKRVKTLKAFAPAVAAKQFKQSKEPVDKGVKEMKAIAVKADKPAKVEFPARTDACGSVAKLLKTLSMAPRGAQFYTSNSTMIVENSKGRELGRIYL
jgi:hypothetical protein